MLANKGKERHVMSMELVDVSFVDNYLNITINHDFYGGVAFFMSRLAFKGKCNSMMLVEVHRSLSLIQILQIQNFEKKKKGGKGFLVCQEVKSVMFYIKMEEKDGERER